MKRNKAARRWLKKRQRAVKGGLAKLAELTVTKPESHAANPSTSSESFDKSDGVLRQNTADFRLPSALAEAGDREHRTWMPSGFVFFVVGLAIVFITIVFWHVSQMPAK